MFDNPIIAEIKRDIISSLPKGANLNELNIMDLWVKNRGGKPASLQIKNETYDIKLSANSEAFISDMSFEQLVLYSSDVVAQPIKVINFFRRKPNNDIDNLINCLRRKNTHNDTRRYRIEKFSFILSEMQAGKFGRCERDGGACL